MPKFLLKAEKYYLKFPEKLNFGFNFFNSFKIFNNFFG